METRTEPRGTAYSSSADRTAHGHSRDGDVRVNRSKVIQSDPPDPALNTAALHVEPDLQPSPGHPHTGLHM
ncbi:hypothetical protein WMY93_027231 [Mugilogobius chulae]|uniref:Uncharacterized protein n=1 Tax=Mugilogobius chulae TaxID=88201 RepID=A0AAW0MSC3_9GOBI